MLAFSIVVTYTSAYQAEKYSMQMLFVVASKIYYSITRYC